MNNIIADEKKTRNILQRVSESMTHSLKKLEEEEFRMKLQINLILLSEKWIQHLNRWIRYLLRVESAIATARRGDISNDILSPDQLLKATADMAKRYPDLNPPQPKDHVNVQGLVNVAKIVIGRTAKTCNIYYITPVSPGYIPNIQSKIDDHVSKNRRSHQGLNNPTQEKLPRH